MCPGGVLTGFYECCGLKDKCFWAFDVVGQLDFCLISQKKQVTLRDLLGRIVEVRNLFQFEASSRLYN